MREQLRKAKLEEERSLSAMQRAQNKIANLQSELASFKEEGTAQETGKHIEKICKVEVYKSKFLTIYSKTLQDYFFILWIF